MRFIKSARVGDRVRVRPIDEILATLDKDGCLEGLPFMPEMARRCGHEFSVLKRVDKVNDLVDRTGLRRMMDAVILDGDRCEGSYHGGCQALCQPIWKEAWLTRVDPTATSRLDHHQTRVPMPTPRESVPDAGPICTQADLLRRCEGRSQGPDRRFRCQQTEMKTASSYMAWWDPRQYWRDWRSGNVTLREMFCVMLFSLFKFFLKRVGGYRLLIPWYDRLQRIRGGEPYPFRSGTLRETPAEKLDLQQGEWVQVKSFEEILATVNAKNRNRGLSFDVEMVKYCKGIYRVLCRVERIIDPKSGRMLNFENDCIILDGVTTRGDHHRFYSQNEYPFWREIWLRRCPTAMQGGTPHACLAQDHSEASAAESQFRV
jgi:hypothetical protein